MFNYYFANFVGQFGCTGNLEKETVAQRADRLRPMDSMAGREPSGRTLAVDTCHCNDVV